MVEIDSEDMLSQLEREPEVEDEFPGHGALIFFGVFFTSMGGESVG